MTKLPDRPAPVESADAQGAEIVRETRTVETTRTERPDGTVETRSTERYEFWRLSWWKRYGLPAAFGVGGFLLGAKYGNKRLPPPK